MTAQPLVIALSAGHLQTQVDRGIDRLFHAGASDITLQADDYIWAYINRRHVCVSDRRLEAGEVEQLAVHWYPGGQSALNLLGQGQALDPEVAIRSRMTPGEDYDPDYQLRCRANITRCRVGNVPQGLSVTLRTIPGVPPKLQDLGLPEEIVQTMFPSQGLVLVAGITGSGKSTLLASGLRHRLEGEEPVKIITAEDPIEFIYPRLPARKGAGGEPQLPRMPEVSQVQLHSHLRDFAMVAPNVLRRKADVIVMGEMRDRESVETGLLLAATGHCTYATLHCETPAEVIARVVSEFPYDSQPAAANKLLDNLRLVISQKIERDETGKGRAFRSWCVFDREFKASLQQVAFPQWSSLIRARMEQRGHDFASQALPLLRAGEISQATFARVAGFNPLECREYLARQAA